MIAVRFSTYCVCLILSATPLSDGLTLQSFVDASIAAALTKDASVKSSGGSWSNLAETSDQSGASLGSLKKKCDLPLVSSANDIISFDVLTGFPMSTRVGSPTVKRADAPPHPMAPRITYAQPIDEKVLADIMAEIEREMSEADGKHEHKRGRMKKVQSSFRVSQAEQHRLSTVGAYVGVDYDGDVLREFDEGTLDLKKVLTELAQKRVLSTKHGEGESPSQRLSRMSRINFPPDDMFGSPSRHLAANSRALQNVAAYQSGSDGANIVNDVPCDDRDEMYKHAVLASVTHSWPAMAHYMHKFCKLVVAEDSTNKMLTSDQRYALSVAFHESVKSKMDELHRAHTMYTPAHRNYFQLGQYIVTMKNDVANLCACMEDILNSLLEHSAQDPAATVTYLKLKADYFRFDIISTRHKL